MAAERERLIAAERERLLAELAFATLDLGTSGTWAERWSALLSELRARGDDLTRLDQQRRQAAGRIAALESDLSDVTRERDGLRAQLDDLGNAPALGDLDAERAARDEAEERAAAHCARVRALERVVADLLIERRASR